MSQRRSPSPANPTRVVYPRRPQQPSPAARFRVRLTRFSVWARNLTPAKVAMIATLVALIFVGAIAGNVAEAQAQHLKDQRLSYAIRYCHQTASKITYPACVAQVAGH